MVEISKLMQSAWYNVSHMTKFIQSGWYNVSPMIMFIKIYEERVNRRALESLSLERNPF